MKYLDRIGLIKTIYCLMMTDRNLSNEEMKQFEEIGAEIDPTDFDHFKEDIITECNEKLLKYKNDPDYYDILQEYIDTFVKDNLNSDTLATRYTIWNLFAVAYNEEQIDQDEMRLIRHVSRTLNMSKADYLEMEQYMKTIVDLRCEKAMLESSSKQYSEIRPMVDSIELRQRTIMQSVTTLINDETYELQLEMQELSVEEKPPIRQKFDSLSSKASETAGKVSTNMKETLSDKVVPVAGELGKGIKKGFNVTAKSLGKAGSSIFTKINRKDNKEEQ